MPVDEPVDAMSGEDETDGVFEKPSRQVEIKIEYPRETEPEHPACRECNKPVGVLDVDVIAPCRCTGSLKYIHAACLAKLCVPSNGYVSSSCEKCFANYKIPDYVKRSHGTFLLRYIGQPIYWCAKNSIYLPGHLGMVTVLFYLLYSTMYGDVHSIPETLLYVLVTMWFMQELYNTRLQTQVMTYARVVKATVKMVCHISMLMMIWYGVSYMALFAVMRALTRYADVLWATKQIYETYGVPAEAACVLVVVTILLVMYYMRRDRESMVFTFSLEESSTRCTSILHDCAVTNHYSMNEFLLDYREHINKHL